ncbi:hypothetical protein IFVP22_C1320315 [Vibrio parahaemolyticus]
MFMKLYYYHKNIMDYLISIILRNMNNKYRTHYSFRFLLRKYKACLL